MGNDLQYAFFIKQHCTRAQPIAQALYNVIICRSWQAWLFRLAHLSRFVHSQWYIFNEEYERQASESVWLDPNHIPVGWGSNESLFALWTHFRVTAREMEGNEHQYPVWTVFVLQWKNYSGGDYNLTSVKKKPTQRKTVIILNHSLFCQKKRESREETIKRRFQSFHKDRESCILCDSLEINELNIKM